MNTNDLPEFLTVLQALAATFNRECDEPMMMGYEMGLDDLPLSTIKVAARRAMRECQRMPSVSELRELVGAAAPSAQDRALAAWGAVQAAMVKHDFYHSVDFDDPAINATLRVMGGWQAFCERMDVDEVKWVQKEFQVNYASVIRSGRLSSEQVAPLPGFFENQNRTTGKKIKPAYRIATGLPPHVGLRIEDRRAVAGLPLVGKDIDV